MLDKKLRELLKTLLIQSFQSKISLEWKTFLVSVTTIKFIQNDARNLIEKGLVCHRTGQQITVEWSNRESLLQFTS